jgi:hypothetical protein
MVILPSRRKHFRQQVDPYTVLLLPCTGADESTSFPDSALGGTAPHTATAYAAAKVRTTHTTPFGDNAGYLLGAAGPDYLRIPDAADFYRSTGDFTIEAWAYFNDASEQYVASQYDGTSQNWRIFAEEVSGTRYLSFRMRNDPIPFEVVCRSSTALSTQLSTWLHLAAVRHNDDWDFYVNGTSVASATENDPAPNLSLDVVVGAVIAGGTAYMGINGRICDFRFSTIARYTSNFTPPATRFSPYL